MSDEVVRGVGDNRYELTGIKFTKNAYLVPVAKDVEDGNGPIFDGERFRSDDLSAYPYMAFDYHDMLFVLKYARHSLDYRVLSNQRNDVAAIGKSVVAEQIVSLFCESSITSSLSFPEHEHDKTIQSDTNFLSNAPFLSVIFVVVRPEVYENYTNSKKDTFGKDCINKIRTRLHNAIKSLALNDEQVSFCINHSLNSGDFVILLKTKYPETAFILSKSLETLATPWNLGLSIECDSPINLFSTYTILTQECRAKSDEESHVFLRCDKTLTSSLISKGGQIVLRIAATPAVNKDILSNKKPERKYVLLGRYDTSITLDFKQYNCLYPFLCSFRLQKETVNLNEEKADREKYYSEYGCEGECEDCAVKGIREQLIKGEESEISIINARFFLGSNFNVPKSDVQKQLTESKLLHRKSRADTVKAETSYYLGLLKKIRQLEFLLPEGHFQFEESIQSLNELIRIYSYMGVQTDMYINWLNFRGYIDSAVKALDLSLEQLTNYRHDEQMALSDKNEINLQIMSEMDGEMLDNLQRQLLNCIHKVNDIYEKRCELTKRMLYVLRRTVDSIEVFSNLSQGVNTHSFAESNYDIQSQANAQKAALALSEYLLSISNVQYSWLSQNRPSDIDRELLPIAIPHLNTSNFETIRLFPHGFISADKAREEKPTHLIAVRVSTIGYLYRIFDTLPLTTHEIAHHNPSVEYRIRNRHLYQVVCKLIADKMASSFIAIADPSFATAAPDPVFDEIARAFYNIMGEMIPAHTYDSSYVGVFFAGLRKSLYRICAHSTIVVPTSLSKSDGVARLKYFYRLYCPRDKRNARQLQLISGPDEQVAFNAADELCNVVCSALDEQRDIVGNKDYLAAIEDIKSALQMYKYSFRRVEPDNRQDEFLQAVYENLISTALMNVKSKINTPYVEMRSLSGHESRLYNIIIRSLRHTILPQNGDNFQKCLPWGKISGNEIDKIISLAKSSHSEYTVVNLSPACEHWEKTFYREATCVLGFYRV